MGDSNGHAEKMKQIKSSPVSFIILNIFKRYKKINIAKDCFIR